MDGRFKVSADGRKVSLICWGRGSPTVILSAGGSTLETFARAQFVRELAQRTQVCAYDRSGTGSSDPAPNERRDADDINEELRALLAAANLDKPYILLGNSFGGMVVAYYAARHPEGVAGVVILDTPAPNPDFNEENEPELVWNFPQNTEHLDVVHGFENRFAAEQFTFDAPLLVLTPSEGESTAQDQSFWLTWSKESRQVEIKGSGFDETPSDYAAEVIKLIEAAR